MDLNLLKTFDVLMQERHVSRAARRLALTQASTSNALDRLRQAFGDRVLERQGNQMAPTRLALDLWPHVQTALLSLDQGLRVLEEFDPRSHRHQFRIGIDEYSLHILGVEILRQFHDQAPNMRLTFEPATFQNNDESLLQGKYDLLIGPVWQETHGFERQILLSESFSGLVAKDHPFPNKVDLDTYIDHPHILISPRGIVPGNVDAGLAALGKERVIAFSTPYYANAPEFLSCTNAILNLGTRLAVKMAKLHNLRLFDIPLNVPGFEIAMVWNKRNSPSKAHSWLRQLIKNCADQN